MAFRGALQGEGSCADGSEAPSTSALGKLLVAALLVLGIALAGCSSGPLPTVAFQAPTETAYSWFQAINDHNEPLALAHFTAASRAAMAWSDFGAISFTNVNCHLVAQTSTAAEVACTFSENAPPGDQADAGWTISMERQPPGPWLIYNYGQG